MKKKVFGIAGFIGSGKTVAGKYFEQLGATFIDADEVVDNLYQKGNQGYWKIVHYFGEIFLQKDGNIDRGKMARFVFNNEHKLRIINDLVHPLVANEVQKKIDAAGSPIVCIEATYFRKEHLGRFVGKIIWIDCKKEILKKRVMKRKGMTEELFQNIYHLQRKPENIDVIIENNGTFQQFYSRLKNWWDQQQ